MELTTEQQRKLSSLETQLRNKFWEECYYGDNPLKELWELYDEGVEVTFSVNLNPYEGYNHPTYPQQYKLNK